ncbi:MAG: hypothetical protein EOL91_13715, partial [Actinobacteria bacterium]|nr:hypothetical protein [Actinomycetota bacterium]
MSAPVIHEVAAPGPDLRDEILALLGRVAEHDGVAAVGEAGLLELRAPLHAPTHLLAHHGDTLA